MGVSSLSRTRSWPLWRPPLRCVYVYTYLHVNLCVLSHRSLRRRVLVARWRSPFIPRRKWGDAKGKRGRCEDAWGKALRIGPLQSRSTRRTMSSLRADCANFRSVARVTSRGRERGKDAGSGGRHASAGYTVASRSSSLPPGEARSKPKCWSHTRGMHQLSPRRSCSNACRPPSARWGSRCGRSLPFASWSATSSAPGASGYATRRDQQRRRTRPAATVVAMC